MAHYLNHKSRMTTELSQTQHKTIQHHTLEPFFRFIVKRSQKTIINFLIFLFGGPRHIAGLHLVGIVVAIVVIVFTLTQ